METLGQRRAKNHHKSMSAVWPSGHNICQIGVSIGKTGHFWSKKGHFRRFRTTFSTNVAQVLYIFYSIAIFGTRPGKPNQRKGQNEKFMNFAHFWEFWCFSLGKQARFTLNFCSGVPLRKVHELAFLWFGLPGPLLIFLWCEITENGPFWAPKKAPFCCKNANLTNGIRFTHIRGGGWGKHVRVAWKSTLGGL